MQRELNDLYHMAHTIWVPRWFDLFSDPKGGFHERLDDTLKPIDMPRRLVTQCRQIMTYSMADKTRYAAKLDEAFKTMRATYDVPDTGIPVFSTADRHYDLYALAFTLSACAAYGTKAAFDYAAHILEFIQINFSADVGLYESLDLSLEPRKAKRRQNPHMHLLEGSMAMFAATKDIGYRAVAEDMVSLFFDRFFDGKHLNEFFNDDLKKPSGAIEAGHHAEWVWLLHRYKQLTRADPRIDSAQQALFDWTKQHGVDPNHGGIFNTQERDGTPVDAGKRIWPQMETLRAAAIMGDTALAKGLIALLQQNYFKGEGLWVEELNRDLSPKSTYLPGTTPYHIYPVLAAALDSCR